MSLTVEEVDIPNFYADQLVHSKWVYVAGREKRRCFIGLRARKKFKIVPMDAEQKKAIDEVLLHTFGFTEWEAEKVINATINTKSGYYIYVPANEYEEIENFPDFGRELIFVHFFLK